MSKDQKNTVDMCKQWKVIAKFADGLIYPHTPHSPYNRDGAKGEDILWLTHWLCQVYFMKGSADGAGFI